MGGQRHALGALMRETPGTRAGRWVSPRAGLGDGRISPPPGFDTRNVRAVGIRYPAPGQFLEMITSCQLVKYSNKLLKCKIHYRLRQTPRLVLNAQPDEFSALLTLFI